MISIWNPEIFRKTSAWSCKEFLVVNGYLVDGGNNCSAINIYAPSSPSSRYELWDQLSIILAQRRDDCVCLIRDFNSVRAVHERNGSGNTWNRHDMDSFNNFIEGSNLIHLPQAGRKYTWYRSNSTCKSRLDRMIVNEEWLSKWPSAVLKCGRRSLSDHCPIFVDAPIKD